MAGYVYSALFYVPRWMAPVKGEPTAKYVTGAVAGSQAEEIAWVLGVGAAEEIILNAGLAALPLMLFGYGLAMGWLDRWCVKSPGLIVPARCAAFWLCGYNLPALMLVFGFMGIVGVLLTKLFTRHSSLQPARRLPASVSPAPWPPEFGRPTLPTRA